MSEYVNFKYCTICRTIDNLIKYKGEYEVTQLLNSLLLLLALPIENRENMHLKAKEACKWFTKNEVIIEVFGNKFYPDDKLRYLRNGIAHLNIKVASTGNDIKEIRIWGENFKIRCKEPCGIQDCKAKQFNEVDGKICVFTFSVEQLRNFTMFVSGMVLSAMQNEPKNKELTIKCPSCKLYNEMIKIIDKYKVSQKLQA